jgi:hypothetical protein
MRRMRRDGFEYSNGYSFARHSKPLGTLRINASATISHMKRYFIAGTLVASACIAILAAIFVPRAAAQGGSVEFVIQVTPTEGVQEPVRGFPVFLLQKSFEDIQKEADSSFPQESLDDFINSLDVSKELKDWMIKKQWITFSGQDFIKKISPDDVMNIPEFFKAYMDRNGGDQNGGFPVAKFNDTEKTKDPAKYAKDQARYQDAIRHYVQQIPESINGIDMSLQDIDPSRKWHEMEAKRAPQVQRRVEDLAQGKYLVARTETNLQGQGFFPNVNPGTYFLSTLDVPATVGDARPRWDFPLTVQPGQVSYAVLSNVNAVQDAAHASP